MQSVEKIEELLQITASNLQKLKSFKPLQTDLLNKKESKDSWSVLECIAHLNRYSDYYLPVFEKHIEKAIYPSSMHFKSGFFGGYFANTMYPKPNTKKIKTFASMNPINSRLTIEELDLFESHCLNHTIQILEKPKNTDLNRVKVPISISKWIKLRLGDALSVVVYWFKTLKTSGKCIEKDGEIILSMQVLVDCTNLIFDI